LALHRILAKVFLFAATTD